MAKSFARHLFETALLGLAFVTFATAQEYEVAKVYEPPFRAEPVREAETEQSRRTKETPVSPLGRKDEATVLDEARGVLMLFGGHDGDDLDDT